VPLKDPVALKKYKADRHIKNRAAELERGRERYKKNPELWYYNSLKNRFGLSVFQYLLLYIAGCWICGKAFEKGKVRPHLDHDHLTNTVRGLSHCRCNVMIGMAGDDPKLLRHAAKSLEKYLCKSDHTK
jgi:hypothetical protein